MGLISPEIEYQVNSWRHWDKRYRAKFSLTQHQQGQSQCVKAYQVCDICALQVSDVHGKDNPADLGAKYLCGVEEKRRPEAKAIAAFFGDDTGIT